MSLWENDPEKLIDIICGIAPTFGGINLEDIKAPECFMIEKACNERLEIPVFHDDQHGTAVIVGAGLLNALEIVNKDIKNIRIVFSGAGAAGFTCAKYLLNLGVSKEQIIMVDANGVVFKGRGDTNYLTELATDSPARSLAEAIKGADVFIGLSVANILTPDMLNSMSHDPIIFAMANPNPEIDYHLALATRDDVIMGTGRSDHPNQINNVAAFPFLFRAALDTRSTTINLEMRLAATYAIAKLAKTPTSAIDENDNEIQLKFGRKYMIPKPYDTRLLTEVSVAVADAAMKSGVAQKPVILENYQKQLQRILDIKKQQFPKPLKKEY